MGKLFDKICRLVVDEKYVIGEHATQRLEERGILEWQAVLGLEDGKLMCEPMTNRIRPLRCERGFRTEHSSRLSGPI